MTDASPSPLDNFGAALAFASATTLAVSAPSHSQGSGKVALFARDALSGHWALAQTMSPSDSGVSPAGASGVSAGQFGHTLAFADGVGAVAQFAAEGGGQAAGCVYIYHLHAEGHWDCNHNSGGSAYGWALALATPRGPAHSNNATGDYGGAWGEGQGTSSVLFVGAPGASYTTASTGVVYVEHSLLHYLSTTSPPTTNDSNPTDPTHGSNSKSVSGLMGYVSSVGGIITLSSLPLALVLLVLAMVKYFHLGKGTDEASPLTHTATSPSKDIIITTSDKAPAQDNAPVPLPPAPVEVEVEDPSGRPRAAAAGPSSLLLSFLPPALAGLSRYGQYYQVQRGETLNPSYATTTTATATATATSAASNANPLHQEAEDSPSQSPSLVPSPPPQGTSARASVVFAPSLDELEERRRTLLNRLFTPAEHTPLARNAPTSHFAAHQPNGPDDV
eukprot:gene25405-30677_t